jgi:hypothetical protein
MNEIGDFAGSPFCQHGSVGKCRTRCQTLRSLVALVQ